MPLPSEASQKGGNGSAEEDTTVTLKKEEALDIQDGSITKTPLAEEEASNITSTDIPNGGLTAWLQVAGAFCIYLTTWGVANSYGVYQTYYQTGFLRSETESNISWIGSIQGFLLFLVGIIAGPLYDAGYLRALVLAGTFLTVFGMMMTSICTTYWQVLLAQGVVVGIGNGLLFLPSVSIVPQYFTTKKAWATGIESMGSSLGGIIFPIIFRQLQPTAGFPWATRTIAFVLLAASTIPIAFMRQRIPGTAFRKIFTLAPFLDLPFFLFSLGLFFGFIGIYVAFYYVELYALAQCNTPGNIASYLLAIVNAGSFFGRLLPSYFADRTGPLNLFLPFAAVTALLNFCWIAVHSTAGVVVFCALYGFFSGAYVSLGPPIMVNLSSELDTFGTRLGMVSGFCGLGLLIGNPIAGAILRQRGSWVGLQVWAGALLSVSVVFIAAARWRKVGFDVRVRI